MFTGLIEEVGSVLGTRASVRPAQLQIAAPRLADEVDIGDSVAVNGCCLTVASRRSGELTFDLLEETLLRTNLKTLHQGGSVNLERALAANGRFGGHLVQGHVDCVTPILTSEKSGDDYRLEMELPSEFARYAASKGSIAVNGISLTIAELAERSFTVWIIPHTRSHTNLSGARVGELVNLEFDLIAKYLERMLDQHVMPSR